MKYKLNENVTHELLVAYGFTYREHYDNYFIMVRQPKTLEVYNEMKKIGYEQEKAEKLNSVKRTYISYDLSVNIKTREVNMWTQALNRHPYEELNHQHDIAEEYIELILDLLKKRIIVKES